MTSGEWPADPSDPRCPSCGEPVSATATYCMHCEVDLPTGPEEARADTGGLSADVTEADPGMPTGDSRGRYGWLDPESTLDDVSTVAVGIVAGLLVGLLLVPLGIWALPDPQEDLAVGIALAGWLAASIWVGYTRTVFEATRKAGYALGVLVALVPVAVAWAIQDAGALLFGVVLWPIAVLLVGGGYGIGTLADDDGTGDT